MMSTLKELCLQKIIESLSSSEIKKLPIILQKEIEQEREDAYANEYAYFIRLEWEKEELEYILQYADDGPDEEWR